MKFRKLFSSRVFLAAILFRPAFALAQSQVVVDWQTQKLISFPQIVNQDVATTVVVNNINDLLYVYQVQVIATARPTDDANSLLALAAVAAAAKPPGVSALTACPSAPISR